MAERVVGRVAGRGLPPAQRERGDVGVRQVLGLLALILVLLLGLLGLAYWMFPGEIQDRRFALPVPPFPAPRLQSDPAADMAAFRAAQRRELNGAGWRDKAAGRVHIPIGQAMALVAKEGIAGWPNAAATGERDRR
jgi:hypothetical protein